MKYIIKGSDPKLTEKRTARMLGTTAEKLAYWRRRRSGPSWIRWGNKVRYRLADINAYVDANRVEPLSQS